jgi:ferric-dicitrate binding protein FerR (iron transport regulator)
MNSSINKDLWYKYFSGGATVFEKKLIDEWAKDPANQEAFYTALALWETQNPQFNPDTNAALQRHLERIQQHSETILEENQTPTVRFFSRWWLAVASVVLVLGLLGWANRNVMMYQTYQTNFGETGVFHLSDGSRVALNANSSLQVPRFGFGKRTREVYLNGEGEFSVKHTSDHRQFIVKTTRNFSVVVLGTEFTVFSRRRGAKVVLNKGKVQLRYQEGKASKQLMMKPGDLITFDQHNQIRQLVTPEPQKHSAWKNHRFIFDETTLEEITYLFAENFGIKMSIAGSELSKWTVSGSFTAQNADELLETLTEASNLSYRKENNEVVIYNKD